VSRVGKKPIPVPSGVTVERSKGLVTVKGPKGELASDINENIEVVVDAGQIEVKRPSDIKEHRALHGLSRSLIANMVEGVSDGFEKKLEIRGVGYRAEMRGANLMLFLGYSHPIMFVPPAEVKIAVNGNTNISVAGIDKQLVGTVAAKIRSFRKPEPYKGKGIRYDGEHVIEKAGKTAGK
jgi:large subunit ribosomal protein L6